MNNKSLRLVRDVVFASVILAVLCLGIFSGCGGAGAEETAAGNGSTNASRTVTAPEHQRRVPPFFTGMAEPRAGDWEEMLRDAGVLRQDGVNTVRLFPPVLITARAGGQPRVILEGEAASAERMIDSFHEEGFSVFVSPTTRMTGFPEQVEPAEATLEHLTEDAVRWAEKAEEKQAELFSPLSRCNLVLGNEAAGSWSAETLLLVREKFKGPIVADVVPDLNGAPEPGAPHDFEALDYRGYDYLALEIFPYGEIFDAQAFNAYAGEVLARAAAVARRDGLKGVIAGAFGSWREAAGTDAFDGPALDAAAQAGMADSFLMSAMPATGGVFYYGWALPGAGAKEQPVEEVIRKYFTAR